MGKEFPMAREEEEGQPMLLARTGVGKARLSSASRNKRKKETSIIRGSEDGEIQDSKTEGKNSRQTERTNASPTKAKRRGRDNQDREQGGGDEGENKSTGRSAQELGIVFPGSYCDEDKTIPHHWVEVETAHGGSLLKCIKCLDYKWLPSNHYEAVRLSNIMEKHGAVEGYCRYLDRRRPVKLLMAKMQDLRRIATKVTDAREFAKLADKILNDKRYDRKEVK